MKNTHSKQTRILAIAPSTRGFGFAVLEEDKLVDWGGKPVKKEDKNKQSLAKVEKLLTHYTPTVLVLEDAAAPGSRRAKRIRTLSARIVTLAKRHHVKVRLLTRAQVRRVFFADEQGTKHKLATLLAERFPEELGSRLPPKRKPWMSQDSRMDMFDAVALALALRLSLQKSAASITNSRRLSIT